MRVLLFSLLLVLISSISFAQPGGNEPPPPEPMPVINVFNPVHHAVQARASFAGPIGVTKVYKVPDGHALVIEFVTAASTAEMWDALLTTTVKGNIADHALSVQPQSKQDKPGVISQIVKIYADPNSTVSFMVNTPKNNTGTVNISGYLVPL